MLNVRLPFLIRIPHSAFRIPHSLILAVTGAVAGAVCLALAFTFAPDLRLEFDRDLPRVTSGFHPVEIVREDSFAWTGRSAVVRMAGADRRAPWRCSVRFRGGRSAPLEQPFVELAADGVTLATRQATNDYQRLEATVPALPSRSGLVLTITSSTTFVPGPTDKRELGVQVDQVVCLRATSGVALPPQRALTSAAISGALFGAGFALVVPVTMAVGATLLVAVAQAIPLATGPGPYSPYVDKAGPLALWIVVAFVLAIILGDRLRREPLSGAARFVLAFTGSALFLQLLALLHPSKLVVDAVFHAHRFQWVLGGRYYFTQPMPDGVQFPYAIGLYVFAAPWAAMTTDHVTLLRIVVCGAQAFAGVLLYAMVSRRWNDRPAGALAVVLFHLVPVPYIVIGNANLTYAFGQAAAFVTITAAVAWALEGRHVGQIAALFLLASVAFLSHVGVFPVLMTALVTSAVLYWVLGGPPLRAPARNVLVATLLAAAFSVVAYYGQFGEVYKSLDRVRGRTPAVAAPDPDTTAAAPGEQRRTIPLRERTVTAVKLALRDFGWPSILLALAGAWDVARGRRRDRLTLALTAMALTYAIFVAFAAWTPVEPRFLKYSDEFIDRVNYATIPLVVVLAARAVSRAWHAGVAGRLASATLVGAAAIIGVRHWAAWLS